MKLASLKSSQPDGELVVVDRRLSRMKRVPAIAPCLRLAIENWDSAAPALQEIYELLNSGNYDDAEVFDAARLTIPFPRTFQFLDGSVFLSHMQKARKARDAAMPPNFDTEPLMYQALSDGFIGPVDDMLFPSEDLGIDMEAEIAIVTDEVPMGTSAKDAAKHIKLVMLLNDYTLRNLTRTELPRGFGFMQAKPTSGFSPVAVTPDELSGWDVKRLHADLISSVNGGIQIGRPNTGRDMYFTYPESIAHAVKSRCVGPGTIIGAGTLANKDEQAGCSCIAEMRANEEVEYGEARTPFLKFCDRVRIEVFDEVGKSIFGAIDQRVAPAT